ncbi:unnamed protein product [Vicia faba]|uniref:Uncharacterized protein n=1 Tax=Vicia faba TaxID=3906 RepID=A0AAV0ZWS3_VICFA|nr:unnamed protein product [Vicia faba]
MFRSRARWLRFVVQFKLFPTTSLCNNSAQRSSFYTSAKNGNNINNKDIITDERFDFHLVQFFLPACLPWAQYARYEIRTMEADVEQKRKKKKKQTARREEQLPGVEQNKARITAGVLIERTSIKDVEQKWKKKEEGEEAKEIEKELELNPPEEKEANSQLSEVIGNEKKPLNSSAPMNTSGGKDNSNSELGEESEGLLATPNSSLQSPTSQGQSGSAS